MTRFHIGKRIQLSLIAGALALTCLSLGGAAPAAADGYRGHGWNHEGHARHSVWVEHRYERPRWERRKKKRVRRWRHHRQHHRHHRRQHRRAEHRANHWGGGHGLPDFVNGGTAIGAIAGGLIGNQFGDGRGRTLATIGGVLAGAVIGDRIYREIKARDRHRMEQVMEETPSGRTVAWENPDTGDQYSVTPTEAFKNADRRDCRGYSTWVFVDGYEKQIEGIACRDRHGRWHFENL